MLLSRNTLIGLAAGGSAALMLGALGFQHLGDLAPCKLCIWQRYPHVIAIVIGIVAVAIRGRLLPYLGMLAALTTSGIGLYHTGIERNWWEGPTSCTSQDISNLSSDQLFDQIVNAPLIRCDEVAWEFMSLSMASWNGLIALGLAGLWFLAARKS